MLIESNWWQCSSQTDADPHTRHDQRPNMCHPGIWWCCAVTRHRRQLSPARIVWWLTAEDLCCKYITSIQLENWCQLFVWMKPTFSLACNEERNRWTVRRDSQWLACASWRMYWWRNCLQKCPLPRYTKTNNIQNIVWFSANAKSNIDLLCECQKCWIQIINVGNNERHHNWDGHQAAQNRESNTTTFPQWIQDQRCQEEELGVGRQIPRLEHALCTRETYQYLISTWFLCFCKSYQFIVANIIVDIQQVQIPCFLAAFLFQVHAVIPHWTGAQFR